MVDNPFTFESGMKVDYDGVIVLARFEQDQNHRYQLNLTFEIDGDETYVQRYGIGNDWASDDGGDTVYHPNGDKARFHQSCAYTSFINYAMKTDAAEEIVKRNNDLYGGGNNGLRHGGLWEGLGFHMDAVTLPGIRQDPETKAWVSGERPLPTKGWVVRESAAPSPSASSSNGAISDADMALIRGAAASSSDVQSFALSVMNLDKSDGSGKMGTDTAITSKLGAPGWFESLKAAN